VTLVESDLTLNIDPTSPITITEAFREISLSVGGTGPHALSGFRITEIRVTVGGEAFDIRDEANNCQTKTIYRNREPRECRFIVNVRIAGRDGQIRIRYRLQNGAEETRTVMVRS
jgi:hypothetical protein